MVGMTSSSPGLSNNGSETSANTGASTPPPPSTAAAVKTPPVMFQRVDAPKNLRGLNKPKCIKCGNVARSRCPYQSCKNCCAKDQNPCHIHVLKANSTLADRGTAPTSTVPEQKPSEAPATGPSVKATSFRQLSSTFAQFNNVHIQRSRKPLTRKEAVTVNEWRFAKLKEYKEANIEAENEAFDRYMHNNSLLEEILDVNSETPEKDDMVSDPSANSDEKSEMISEAKVILRSNPTRIDTFRKRIRQTIDQGMRKLEKCDSTNDPSNPDDDQAPQATKSCWAGKTVDFTELNFKLNQALNVDDLKRCIEMKSNITGQLKISVGNEAESTKVLDEQNAQIEWPIAIPYVSSKLVRTRELDQDTLNRVNSHFSTLEDIEDL